MAWFAALDGRTLPGKLEGLAKGQTADSLVQQDAVDLADRCLFRRGDGAQEAEIGIALLRRAAGSGLDGDLAEVHELRRALAQHEHVHAAAHGQLLRVIRCMQVQTIRAKVIGHLCVVGHAAVVGAAGANPERPGYP